MSVPDRLFSVFCTLDKEPADVAEIRLSPALGEKPPSLDLHWKNAAQPFAVYYTDVQEAENDLDAWQACDKVIRLAPAPHMQIGARDFSPPQYR